MSLLLLALSVALAAEPPPPADAEPTVAFGPVVSEARVTAPDPADLRLGPCIEKLPPPPALSEDSALMLQVRIRRGRARIVTAADVAPGLEPLTPCLERELLRVDWGVKKADVELPVTVAPVASDDEG